MSAQRGVTVFGSSTTTEGSEDWRSATEVGRRLAAAGFSVITGGYGGSMEAVSQGASEVGGLVVGVTAPTLFPARPGANRHVTEVIEADSLLDRLGIMMARASAAIALPGSIGTATELLLAWNHNYLARRNGADTIPTAAVGEQWRLLAGLVLSQQEAEADQIHLVATGEEAVDWVLDSV